MSPQEQTFVKHPLAAFSDALDAGSIRIVDLTHALSPAFPTLALPPQFGQVWPFKLENISRYDPAGPGWYWNNFSCGEHTGTHFDAPAHWITGKKFFIHFVKREIIIFTLRIRCSG